MYKLRGGGVRDHQCKSEISNYNFLLLLTNSMAQQPLKSFDRPLMRISLSNSILVTLTFY